MVLGYLVGREIPAGESLSLRAMSYLIVLKSFLFSTRRKRVDFYLFVLLIVALWAGRGSFNAWLMESVGERMSMASAFLSEM